MTEQAIVRKATIEDVGQMASLFNQIVEAGDAFLSEEPISSETMAMRMHENTMTYVAEMDHQIVGFYDLHPVQPGRGSHIANASYLVDTRCRGLGIGKSLGLHSLEKAKKYGFTAIQFNAVVSTNEAAVQLWQNLGFKITGTVTKGFRHKEKGYVDLLIMYKKL